MIDKKHLWKRSNRWWVRIKVPDRVRHILMKRQLTKNLYTSDLQEAIRRKHKVVAMLKEQIYLAEKRIDGTYESLSKENKLLNDALESRIYAESHSEAGYDPEKEHNELLFEDLYDVYVNRIYGKQEAESILYSHIPGYEGPSPNQDAVENLKKAIKLSNPESQPLKLVSEKFFKEQAHLKTSTKIRKTNNIQDFMKWIGMVDIREIKKVHAGNYVTYLSESGKMAHNTLSNKVSDIKSLFTWAESRGIVEYNPFVKVLFPKKAKKLKRIPWDNNHILTFLNFPKIEFNDIAATAIALYTGLRLDEICNLKFDDIYEDAFHIHEGKTESASRTIPIHSILTNLLTQCESKSKDGYVITGLNPGGYDQKRSWNFQKRLGRLRKQAGLPETVVFHSLRNTFATRMENLGVPKNHISQLMGHEDGNMALDVYSGGLAIEPLRESMRKLSYGEEIDNHLNKGII